MTTTIKSDLFFRIEVDTERDLGKVWLGDNLLFTRPLEKGCYSPEGQQVWLAHDLSLALANLLEGEMT